MKRIWFQRRDSEGFTRLLKTSVLARNSINTIKIASRRLAVFCSEGQFVVSSGECPHRLLPLNDAKIENGQIICPHHNWAFDSRDGMAQNGSGACLTIYRTKISNDYLWVKLT